MKKLIIIICLLMVPSQLMAKEMIYLLHGLGRTHRSMKKMEKFFRKKGYDVVNLRFNSRKNSIKHIANTILKKSIDENVTDVHSKVHFVGHSLGSIVVRTYLQENKRSDGGRLIMLSPPNQGSALAEKLKNNFLFKSAMGPAGQELGTGDDSLPKRLKPVSIEIGIITGNRSENWIFSSMIPGPDDGKVSVEEAKLDEAKDFLVLPLNHTFIMTNEVVLEQCLNFIQSGTFDYE